MSCKKVILTSLTALFLWSAICAGAWAGTDVMFSDIQNHWAAWQIESVCEQGIMHGIGNGLFAPDRPITRAELAVCLYKTFKLDTGDKQFIKAPSLEDYYNDVKPGEWYSDAVLMCAVNDIFTPEARRFKPEEPVNRLEAAQAIEKCFTAKKIPVVTIMLWPVYKDLSDEETTKIVFVSNAGIMKGYNGYFRPYDKMTRAEAACALERSASIIRKYAPAMEKTSLAGLHLGDPGERVAEILGENYDETYIEEPGYYGEKQVVMNYKTGVTVIVGQDSKKILAIRVESPLYATGLGDRVGDSAEAVLEKYRPRYEEYQGPNSEGKNTGWFKLEDGSLLIFDFDKRDGTRFNNEINENSKVEVIELMYADHLD